MTFITGLGLTDAWKSGRPFFWATGQRLLSHPIKHTGGAAGRQSHYRKRNGTPFFDRIPRSSVPHTRTRNNDRYAISPASYVDDVEPLANPCSPDGALAPNATQTSCKVYAFHH